MTSEPTPSNWSDESLERYLDDDLNATEMSALADDLRRSAPLRERLARRSQENDLVRAALEVDDDEIEKATAHRRRQQPFVLGATVMSAVAAAIAIAFVWPGRGERPSIDRTTENVVRASEGEDADAEASVASRSESRASTIRVVLAIERSRPDPDRQARPEAENETMELAGPAPMTMERLDRALATGDVDAAIESLRAAPDDASREDGFSRLATILRSAETSERVLDQLPPAEQVAVCRLWAEDPRMRPVSFERLQRLSTDPAVSSAVSETLERLYHNRTLRPWMRSYGLADSRGPRSSPVG
ncbi:MAG: hypothetical protein ACF8PN_12780 [Phycisphaerales bacterium]